MDLLPPLAALPLVAWRCPDELDAAPSADALHRAIHARLQAENAARVEAGEAVSLAALLDGRAGASTPEPGLMPRWCLENGTPVVALRLTAATPHGREVRRLGGRLEDDHLEELLTLEAARAAAAAGRLLRPPLDDLSPAVRRAAHPRVATVAADGQVAWLPRDPAQVFLLPAAGAPDAAHDRDAAAALARFAARDVSSLPPSPAALQSSTAVALLPHLPTLARVAGGEPVEDDALEALTRALGIVPGAAWTSETLRHTLPALLAAGAALEAGRRSPLARGAPAHVAAAPVGATGATDGALDGALDGAPRWASDEAPEGPAERRPTEAEVSGPAPHQTPVPAPVPGPGMAAPSATTGSAEGGAGRRSRFD